MNKLQKQAQRYEQFAKYKKERNSIDFAMNFMQAYLDQMPASDTETMDLYKETIKETIADLDSVRQLYSYLIGDKQ